ncbi:type I-E CRISPR-associated protein Cas6/Cse3/CasE [Streptomyces sp. URMC 129]|uniref:type I-E CRISPR-associated protein Cas6/Cse3/CasE n=1 Tax=Streptomyces sp. URMC 129 TaxID=3423407 RepID=UPI003F1C80A7
MSYLSRVRINPLRTASRQLLDNPRALHGAVQGGIPGDPRGERVLWRLDSDNPRRPHLLVLTGSRPDWTHLVEQAGWPGADGEHCTVRDYRPLLEQLAPGREFAFRVTANPVQNVARPVKPSAIQKERMERMERMAADGEGRQRSFRLGHRTAAAQLGWFLGRTAKWGFEVPEARMDRAAPGLEGRDGGAGPSPVEVRITARHRRAFRKAGLARPVVLQTVTFEGRLRIVDVARFRQALLGGIGPGKAYGCGLLTLAPVRGAAVTAGG